MLGYSYIDWTSPVPVPERSLNGGLYTGAPFAQGAEWANVPIEPDAIAMSQALKSANPPPRGAEIIASSMRPGNNYVASPYHARIDPAYQNIAVIKK